MFEESDDELFDPERARQFVKLGRGQPCIVSVALALGIACAAWLVIAFIFGQLVGSADAPDRAYYEVVRVVDGDTLLVQREGRTFAVHLEGIDCPEADQPFGGDATRFTTEQALDKRVNLRHRYKTQDGDTLADIAVFQGSQSLSRSLLEAGLAWWDRERAGYDKHLWELEGVAKASKRGLWQQESPVPPWEWRERHKGKQTGERRDESPDAEMSGPR